jgi:hypothetical protein
MSPSFSFIKPVSPPKVKKTQTPPISPFHLSAPFTYPPSKDVSPKPKPQTQTHKPKPHNQRENIASQQNTSYAMAINHDGFCKPDHNHAASSPA